MNRAILLAIIMSWTATAGADVVHLADGRSVEGKVVQESADSVQIKIPNGIVTFVNRKEIVSVERGPNAAEVYQSMAEQTSPDNAEAHFQLGLWCRDHNLAAEANSEFKRAIEIDPEHAGAHEALGHVQTESGWGPRGEPKTTKATTLADDAEYGKIERYRRFVDTAIYKIHSLPRAQSKEWVDRLAAMNDPIAAPRMIILLDDRDALIRAAACNALLAMKHKDAVPALVQRTLYDSDATVRSAALTAAAELDRNYSRDLLHGVVAGLNAQPITTVSEQQAMKRLYDRTAIALGVVGNLDSVPFLIQILYPNIEIVETNEGGTKTGMFRSAGDGVDDSGLPTNTRQIYGGVGQPPPNIPRERFHFNDAAEQALKNLTGQNLGVSPKDWNAWWVMHGPELKRRSTEPARQDGDVNLNLRQL